MVRTASPVLLEHDHGAEMEEKGEVSCCLRPKTLDTKPSADSKTYSVPCAFRFAGDRIAHGACGRGCVVGRSSEHALAARAARVAERVRMTSSQRVTWQRVHSQFVRLGSLPCPSSSLKVRLKSFLHTWRTCTSFGVLRSTSGACGCN